MSQTSFSQQLIEWILAVPFSSYASLRSFAPLAYAGIVMALVCE